MDSQQIIFSAQKIRENNKKNDGFSPQSFKIN